MNQYNLLLNIKNNNLIFFKQSRQLKLNRQTMQQFLNRRSLI